MGIRIKFDTAGNPIKPKIQLANKNYHKLGYLNTVESINFKGNMNDAHELSFNLYKEKNGIKCAIWDKVTDFKYIYIDDYETYFEIEVTLSSTNMNIKNITATSIDKAELSQTNLYDIEINSDTDIARDDYVVTTIYNPTNASASLLDRVLSKTPQWTIAHVDSTIMNIQKTFSISETTTYEFLRSTLSDEVSCYVDFDTTNRTVSVYDLMYNVISTGYRGELSGIPEGTLDSDIIKPYGDDTKILITTENLASEIKYTSNYSELKNCYVIEGGDDTVTATVRNISPSGTNTFYYISDETRADMSTELSDKLDQYDVDYKYYNEEYVFPVDSTLKTNYNNLVDKYYSAGSDKEITTIVGYSQLTEQYYNTIDFNLYLTSSFLPTVVDSTTTAEEQLALLTTANLSPVAVADVSVVSVYTANNAVLLMCKSIIQTAYYKVEIVSSNLVSQTWTGYFKVTNRSDDTDTATSTVGIIITINDDQQTFVEQRIQKELAKQDIGGLTDLMAITDIGEFDTELTKYCLNRLSSFQNAYQTAIDVLTEENCGSTTSVLYSTLYTPYFTRLTHIEAEILVRSNEIAIIDEMSSVLSVQKTNVQTELNFNTYLGATLLAEFSAFRREYKYTNSNYISTGLDNAQLIDKTQELIKVGTQTLYNAATGTHSITASVNNLLVLPSFQPLADSFKLGNYIRVKVESGSVYKLRLLSYIIDYEQIQDLTLEFSDIINETNNNQILKQIVNQVSSVSSDMPNVKQQASQGSDAQSTVKTWTTQGLDLTSVKLYNNVGTPTVVNDEHGTLYRYYYDITETYSDEQMRLMPTGMVLTDDSWASLKTAVGKFSYIDPVTSEEKTGWGVNGEVLVGKLILGENLGVYNTSGSLTFNDDGLKVSNSDSTRVVTINPNSTYDLFSYTLNGQRKLYIDNDGYLNINGKLLTYNTDLSRVISINPYSTTDVFSYSKDGVRKFYVDSNGDINVEGNIFGSTINGSTITGSVYISPYGTYGSIQFDNGQLKMISATATDVLHLGWITGDNPYLAINSSVSSFGFGTTSNGFNTFSNKYTFTPSTNTHTLSGYIDGAVFNRNYASASSVGSQSVYFSGKSLSVFGGATIDGDFTVQNGSKNMIVKTENYGKVLQYCVEATVPLFEDIGSATLDEYGMCYIDIENVYLETINTDVEYFVQITKYGEGDVWVNEMNNNYFVIKGTPNLRFCWSIKARQKGYTNERLERFVDEIVSISDDKEGENIE